eukprot:CAMPEP_0181171830 /NCGR_PEP_ID=MMETSP1096-20121128/2123_1 /TAXON_ID=156174 ORGANISM="Chrysochromulina ericina, Strain CCMP281" /NCGR_SAMPLE_ID=MMETSP1096 /ASSEMBLY_ACC=CAM_ASM_000453 /LENGTH=118 /DNA_ID=CAMNT_0023259513 /DNA_START=1038 /DNA_END=1394 /DNA_ORIENTATION=+
MGGGRALVGNGACTRWVLATANAAADVTPHDLSRVSLSQRIEVRVVAMKSEMAKWNPTLDACKAGHKAFRSETAGKRQTVVLGHLVEPMLCGVVERVAAIAARTKLKQVDKQDGGAKR